MDNYHKYLKYKKKYTDLKKQYGSGPELEKLKTSKHIEYIIKQLDQNMGTNTYMPSSLESVLLSGFQVIKRIYRDETLQDEIKLLSDSDKNDLLKNKNLNIINNFFIKLLDMNILNEYNINTKIEPGLLNLLNLFGNKVVKKACSAEEFMTLENPGKLCNNPTKVDGSCGDPLLFFGNIHDINNNNEKIVEFLDLLTKANSRKKTIDIILGSRSISANIVVTFDPLRPGGKTLDYHIKNLREGSVSSIYHINNGFPLNADGTNKDVLDKILEMTTKFKVNIINKMCGTCHRSLYYLVHTATGNFSYTVNPEQGLGPQDTEEIQKCFKI